MLYPARELDSVMEFGLLIKQLTDTFCDVVNYMYSN